METRKRKLIDLNPDTFRILSIKAAEKGTNLKGLIEKSLDILADDIEESEMYAYLVKNYPEGKEIISAQEKNDFENWLGV